MKQKNVFDNDINMCYNQKITYQNRKMDYRRLYDT